MDIYNVNGYTLDKDQKKVLHCKNKAILVLAGAGSGKSLTMIGKIRYLIEVEHINPSDILPITFTNLAAANLENNINKYNYVHI